MSPIPRGFIFLAIGAGLQAIIGFAITPALLGGMSTATNVLAVIGMAGAAAYGFFAGYTDVYEFGPRGIALYVVDVTWSALNTFTGMVFLIRCKLNGIYQQPDADSKKRGIIHYEDHPFDNQPKAALGGADATTIGNVMGGKWLTHETIHVQQARIFGPFYWFTYLFGYFANAVPMFVKWLVTGQYKVPYKGKASISFVHWEAYGRVVMEDWAYRSAPTEAVKGTINLRGPIEVGPWILWFFIALVNVLAIAVTFAPIPFLGAIPAAIGLGAIPFWIGIIVLLVYATIRAFFSMPED